MATITKWKRHRSDEEIALSEMKDEHLQAAIAMIKRGYDRDGMMIGPGYEDILPYLEKEIIKRGLVPSEDGWDI